jgi:hypothetical protein
MSPAANQSRVLAIAAATALVTAVGTNLGSSWLPGAFSRVYDWATDQQILVVYVKRDRDQKIYKNVQVTISDPISGKPNDSGPTGDDGIVRLHASITYVTNEKNQKEGRVFLKARIDEADSRLEYQEILVIPKLPTSLTLDPEKKWSRSALSAAPIIVTPSLTIQTSGTSIQIIHENSGYSAKTENQTFFVGREVKFQGGVGLIKDRGRTYRAEDYQSKYGNWAVYASPIIFSNSGGVFDYLNTYDRARLSFGLLSWPAHIPDGGLVVLMRRLLALPEGRSFFPDLSIEDGRIHKKIVGQPSASIETDESTDEFMNYLNPSQERIDPITLQNAAKLVVWANTSVSNRDVQVSLVIEELKRLLQRADKRLGGLDGVSDKLCLVILDILVQGRGKYDDILKALHSSDPYSKLLDVGAITESERGPELRSRIEQFEKTGQIGRKIYRTNLNDFVDQIIK